jgi:hypothetical protein
MPEDSVEQRINAEAVARAGFGQTMPLSTLTGARLRQFLAAEPQLRDRTRWCVRDGRADAIAALERFVSELAPRPRSARALPKVA